MAKIFEAMQRAENAGGTTAVEEAPIKPFAAKPIQAKPVNVFPEYQDEENERCKQELIAHLNRFAPKNQPMKLSERIANFFKMTKN